MTKPNITVGMLLAIAATSLKSPNESSVDDVIARNIQAHKSNPNLDQVLSFSDAVTDRVLELLPDDLKAPREIDLTGKPTDLDSNEKINVDSADGSSGAEGDSSEVDGDSTGSADGAEGAESDGNDSGNDSGANVSAAGDVSAGPAGDVSAETGPSQPQPTPAPAPKPQQKPTARK